MPQQKKYDLHSHTCFSPCSTNNIEKLLERAKKAGLNGIAITDHNEIKGALLAKELNKDPNFEVIIGEEVMTEKGEILAYYVTEKIMPGKYEDVIKEIRRQDAVCSIAHPFTSGIRKSADLNFGAGDGAALGDLKPDAIEVFNARQLKQKENDLAREFATKNGFAMTGGSDGHFLFEIGAGYTLFEGDLKTAMRQRKTDGQGQKKYPILERFFSLFVKTFKKLLH